ncbi:hypothetical protein [Shewanella sp. 1180_01]|uniref:hypothetical protein n=1 Tax=Shewanella sp. 1180_01 TaxID=2604451 RepID=UPI0040647F41
MSRARNFVLNLLLELKEQLDSMIRKEAYGNSTAIADWLHEPSRTAVARYEQALKRKDGVPDMAGSFNATVKASVAGGELASLYQELGELEYKKSLLLERIRDLME